ncbi:MAG TPA: hypothetical protein VK845_02185, partial [Gemmatimonadales bacterium]|nr:hypothetical protein [Gemmatimonadales bacterium]
MCNRATLMIIAFVIIAFRHAYGSVSSLSQGAQGPVLIENAWVIDMRADAPPRIASVLVQDGLVAAIGPLEDSSVSDDVQRVDGTGRFLLPGLTDAHVHLLDRNDLPVL